MNWSLHIFEIFFDLVVFLLQKIDKITWLDF